MYVTMKFINFLLKIKCDFKNLHVFLVFAQPAGGFCERSELSNCQVGETTSTYK
jgi:hypothetical protein